ncbi:hypothetical protein JCM8097_008065 [Rhodosporidiobolus ruineniae]
MMDMGNSMDSSSTMTTVDGLTACLLGDNNGTWPNGTLGMGKWLFGVYVPTAAEKAPCQAYQGTWADSVKYGEWTSYLVGGFFAVCAVFNLVSHWADMNRSIGLGPVLSWPRRFVAVLRMVDQLRPHRLLPSLGTTLVSLGLLLFGCLVSFAIFPYYRPPNYGSSPLGLRTEWVATALIVWIIATGVKGNALAVITGLPYSRLLDWHKSFGWICLFFSIVHTGAMIVRANREAPWWYTWQIKPLSYGWAAWGALISLAWLCIMSLGPVRRLSHEFFYSLHMVGNLLFIVMMYYHCDNLLASWSYMHATVVVLGVALLYRFAVVAYRSGGLFRPRKATVEVIEDGALRISVDVGDGHGRGADWQAGEHVFIRFLRPSLFPWQTHPFTIANLPAHSVFFTSSPSSSDDLEKQDSAPAALPPSSSSSTMTFILRPYSGLTRRLFQLASSCSSTVPVLLDGPYSSHSTSGSPAALLSLSAADRALLICGGTGLSFALPMLLAALAGTCTTAPSARMQVVEVHWAARHESCFDWYREVFEQVRRAAKERGVALRIVLHWSRADDGKEVMAETALAPGVEVSAGRPDGPKVTRKFIETSAGHVAVLSCGPASLARSVRNAVACEQGRIVAGALKAVEAIELVEELYDC